MNEPGFDEDFDADTDPEADDDADYDEGPVLASFGRRSAGFVLDFLPLFIIVTVPFNLAHPQTHARTSATYVGLVVSIFVLAWGVYGTFCCHFFDGRTFGMWRLGLRCVDEPTGEPPSFSQSLVRGFSATLMLGAALLGTLGLLGPAVDLLWANWDPKNQTLHDKMARTVVIH